MGKDTRYAARSTTYSSGVAHDHRQARAPYSKFNRGQCVMLCSLVEQRINTLAGNISPERGALRNAWIKILGILQEM